LPLGARVQTGSSARSGCWSWRPLLGIVWASLSSLIALRSRNAELTMIAGLFLTLPALFLSSAFLPAAAAGLAEVGHLGQPRPT
jgi:hypothetical protein